MLLFICEFGTFLIVPSVEFIIFLRINHTFCLNNCTFVLLTHPFVCCPQIIKWVKMTITTLCRMSACGHEYVEISFIAWKDCRRMQMSGKRVNQEGRQQHAKWFERIWMKERRLEKTYATTGVLDLLTYSKS